MKSWLLSLLLGCVPALVFAAASGRDMAVEAKIEQELRAIDPTLVQPFQQARIAFDKKDYAEAARLLQQIEDKAPAFDPAARRLGAALAEAGHREEGLKWAEKAVALKRSAANLSSLAYLLVVPSNGKPTTSDLTRAQALLRECGTLPDGQDVYTLFLTAQVSLQLDQPDNARAAVEKLERLAPDEIATHYFAAILAAHDEHWNKADHEIRQAQKLGLEGDTVQRFLDSGVHREAVQWWWIGFIAWVVGLWAVGLTLLCGLGFFLSWATLQQVARSDATVPITGGERWLRRIYRVVLNITGIYYYISLPIIIVLVIGIAGGLIYAFLMAGRIPIQLTIMLIVGAFATIVSMVRSLFVRVQSEDPGRSVTREEADGLWKLAEEVAATVNTRPVDDIRITPGTDLCVYERGSWREKMEDRAKRVLVVGAAVMNDFKQQDFRSVLAHEYGHFAHRDTAGGDVALRVRGDIWQFYLAMREAGQATWLNLAFHFLRLYHFIFRRISHGATRLQEVLADRVAAQTYGPVAFEGGLRHVMRRSIEFETFANLEIKAALDAKRPLQNLYEPVTQKSDSVEQAFETALARETTEDDTHPAPKDRFRLIARIPAPIAAPPPGHVWDLFKDPAAVHREMTDLIEKRIAGHRH